MSLSLPALATIHIDPSYTENKEGLVTKDKASIHSEKNLLSWNTPPDVVLSEICSYASAEDLAILHSVSRAFARISIESKVWENLFQKTYTVQVAIPMTMSWKQHFAHCYTTEKQARREALIRQEEDRIRQEEDQIRQRSVSSINSFNNEKFKYIHTIMLVLTGMWAFADAFLIDKRRVEHDRENALENLTDLYMNQYNTTDLSDFVLESNRLNSLYNDMKNKSVIPALCSVLECVFLIPSTCRWQEKKIIGIWRATLGACLILTAYYSPLLGTKIALGTMGIVSFTQATLKYCISTNRQAELSVVCFRKKKKMHKRCNKLKICERVTEFFKSCFSRCFNRFR